MKYVLIFLLILFFIAPSVDEAKSIPQVLKAGVYNYITCLDKSVDYLSENYPVFNQLTELPYKKSYTKVMKNRTFVKHFVETGETLDDIIKIYNKDIDNIDNFRKVVYNENSNVVSDDYKLKSGEYILIPSE
ncbi:hypothetical protein NSA42_05505 [Paeniclostridium sordellii]|uniref:hypothetical protein n=1 Tax=Paraclostridium sordellii TaxID=1505 RepID=UPI002149F521|nr:hypothetical protein [Paeniclostridium sordellii]MCR1848729.1 hypothetical protein [Paeniclostridium sordellii]